MSKKTTISCPNCKVDIDVNDLLYHQLEEQLQQEFKVKLQQEQARYKQRETELQSLQKTLEQQQQSLQDTIDLQVSEQLAKKRTQLEGVIQQRLEKEQTARIESMEKELDDKTQKLSELNQVKSQIGRLQREKQELKSQMALDAEKKLNALLAEKSAKLKKQMDEQVDFKVAEKEQVIQQLRDQLSVAQQKAEQGSTQLQGEIQELAIEQWLKQQFPLDDIDEIKKGASGADTLQTIHTQSLQHCGSIYYESKRTKQFQPAWIAKFKDDIQRKEADIGVLVTQTMPSDFDSLGQIDGVWVCTFDTFKHLSQVLRESLITLKQNTLTHQNRGDKMGMLYDFLTGKEFRMQIEAIVEGFTQLKSDLEAEKRAMQGIWKKREKQIDRVLTNTHYMYGSIRGIAGSAIQPVALLELNSDQNEE